MAKTQKIVKGEPEYLNRQKKIEIIKTVVFFGLSLAIFAMGYWSTKTKENLLTVVAIAGLLPSSRSAVSMIMYLRTPKYSEEVLHKLQNAVGEVQTLYHLYLTSYKENYPLNCVSVRGNQIMGYTDFASCNAVACEEHIKLLATQNGIKNINIKIFKGSELKKFEERLQQLQHAETSSKEEELINLLKDISL